MSHVAGFRLAGVELHKGLQEVWLLSGSWTTVSRARSALPSFVNTTSVRMVLNGERLRSVTAGSTHPALDKP
jgi:hypothetical protein